MGEKPVPWVARTYVAHWVPLLLIGQGTWVLLGLPANLQPLLTGSCQCVAETLSLAIHLLIGLLHRGVPRVETRMHHCSRLVSSLHGCTDAMSIGLLMMTWILAGLSRTSWTMFICWVC